MIKIMCVEENKEYRETLAKELQNHDYIVETVENPIKGFELLAQNKYNIVISGYQLPIMDGILFVESAKNIQPDIKTIILTSNADEVTELKAIKSKVDLYLEKDKSFRLILGYVNSLAAEIDIRKHSRNILVSNEEEIILDTRTMSVVKKGKSIHLTPKEFELLKVFLSNKNELLLREDIVNNLWPDNGNEIDLRSVDTHVKKLRDKLNTRAITSVRGYGYRWTDIV